MTMRETCARLFAALTEESAPAAVPALTALEARSPAAALVGAYRALAPAAAELNAATRAALRDAALLIARHDFSGLGQAAAALAATLSGGQA